MAPRLTNVQQGDVLREATNPSDPDARCVLLSCAGKSSDGSQSANSARLERASAEPLRFSGLHFTFEAALGPNPQRPCFVCLGATTLGKNDDARAAVFAGFHANVQ